MRSLSYISSNNTTFCKAIILGVVASVVTIASLLCIVTMLFLTSALPPVGVIEYCTLAIDAISVFVGGYIAARINKSKGLVVGTCVGAIVLISVLIIGFSTSSSTLTLITLLKTVTFLLFSALGGIKGVNVKEKIKIK